MTTPVILWLRQDLRLADQPALVAAAGEGRVVPVYILDDETPGDRRMGAASRWWLHHSLAALSEAFAEHGVRLILRGGRASAELAKLAAELGTNRVHALRHYEPWWKTAESEVALTLDLQLHDGNFLGPPDRVRTATGGRYRIFTPWWTALKQQMPPAKPLAIPDLHPDAPPRHPDESRDPWDPQVSRSRDHRIVDPGVRRDDEIWSDSLADWNLLPTNPDWATGFSNWTPGEAGARAALRDFLPAIPRYDHDRNYPAIPGTSRLSPHLHFGEISPATVWWQCAAHARAAAEPYLRQIGWRDFANNVIDMFPDYGDHNGRAAFDAFPWHDDEPGFVAWTQGRTGYPLVDAGMRELWSTGWMHNRVRMIAASFLVKHLLVDWRRGERWFWDTLVDADYAANAQNWQWTAGSGIDSAPFYRIMAPLAQADKFEAAAYIRRWVPEVDTSAYPEPLIGHRAARERALDAFRTINASS